jgi:hypothetical protein
VRQKRRQQDGRRGQEPKPTGAANHATQGGLRLPFCAPMRQCLPGSLESATRAG